MGLMGGGLMGKGIRDEKRGAGTFTGRGKKGYKEGERDLPGGGKGRERKKG